MPLLSISSRRLGREPNCRACGAGSTVSFNWEYAKTTPDSETDLSVFVSPEKLRWGTLFQCMSCRQPWYLDGDAQFMNCVSQDRLPLIYSWNQHEIILNSEHLARLNEIGRTPPDLYGNGAKFHETPCRVVTKSEERIDLAIVSQQRHAPFEEWRHYRLACEIKDVYPSPHALPLSIRIATSRAEEIRMGFAPTLAEIPNGELIILNWTHNFLVRQDCKSNDTRLSKKQIDWNHMPEIHSRPEDITYFVADIGPDIVL